MAESRQDELDPAKIKAIRFTAQAKRKLRLFEERRLQPFQDAGAFSAEKWQIKAVSMELDDEEVIDAAEGTMMKVLNNLMDATTQLARIYSEEIDADVADDGIGDLLSQGKITTETSDLLHRIRKFRNDMTHESIDVSPEKVANGIQMILQNADPIIRRFTNLLR